MNPEEPKEKRNAWPFVAGLLIIPAVSGGIIAWQIGDWLRTIPETISIIISLFPVVISSFIVTFAYEDLSVGKRIGIRALFLIPCFISYVFFLFAGCIANFDIH